MKNVMIGLALLSILADVGKLQSTGMPVAKEGSTSVFQWEHEVELLEWESPEIAWVLKEQHCAKCLEKWKVNGLNITAVSAETLLQEVRSLAALKPPQKASSLKEAKIALTVTVIEKGKEHVYQGVVLPDQPGFVWMVPGGSSWAYPIHKSTIQGLEQKVRQLLLTYNKGYGLRAKSFQHSTPDEWSS